MYDFDDDDDEEPRGPWRAVVIVGTLIIGAGWFIARPALEGRRGGTGSEVVIQFDSAASSTDEVGVSESSIDLATPTDAPTAVPVPSPASSTTTPSVISTVTTSTTEQTTTTSTTTTEPPTTTTSTTTSTTTTERPTTTTTSTTEPPTTTTSSTTTTTTTEPPTTTTTTTTEPPTTTTTSTTEPPTTTTTSTTEPPTTTTTSTTEPPTTTTTSTTEPPTTTTSSTTTTTTTEPPTTTTSTTEPPTTTTSTTEPSISNTVSTLPDGRPVSATAVLAGDTIVLTGTVASRHDGDRLVLFVRTYWAEARTVDDELLIDPQAQVSSGLRLVDLDAARFEDDSDVITPALAAQLDRLVVVLRGTPELTLHVVGNTDQDGDPTRNLVVSQRRASAVVDYLASRGVSRSRLTTQPAGESNPLPPELIGSAPPLNNRTEVVVFGLLGG